MVNHLNATEKHLYDDRGNEIPQIMPAYARKGKVYRLPEEKAGTIVFVGEDVMKAVEKLVASKQMNSRSDLRIAM
jgi:hypothetical protein